MKKLFIFSFLVIIVFSACKKNDEGSTAAYRTSETNEDILPDVSLPHSIVVITNNADNDDALIEKVYTGANADAGGKFPVRRGANTKMISTNLGENTFLITLRKTDTESLFSIVDSDGILHSQNITGSGYETVTFENVVVKEASPVFLNFSAKNKIPD
jgi:hypothetical protein